LGGGDLLTSDLNFNNNANGRANEKDVAPAPSRDVRREPRQSTISAAAFRTGTVLSPKPEVDDERDEEEEEERVVGYEDGFSRNDVAMDGSSSLLSSSSSLVENTVINVGRTSAANNNNNGNTPVSRKGRAPAAPHASNGGMSCAERDELLAQIAKISKVPPYLFFVFAESQTILVSEKFAFL
jgi:hypothetical protein